MTINVISRRFDRTQPVVAAVRLGLDDYFRHYERLLRQRLSRLPATYEFTVLRAAHELGEVCARIARYAAAPGTDANGVSAMYRDLHTMAFRGIVIGIHSLAYHCLGMDLGCQRDDAVRILEHIRRTGTLTRRELQRKFPKFAVAERDRLLERLAAEGLVELDGKNITAVQLKDFIAALHARPEFPEAEYLCPVQLGPAT